MRNYSILKYCGNTKLLKPHSLPLYQIKIRFRNDFGHSSSIALSLASKNAAASKMFLSWCQNNYYFLASGTILQVHFNLTMSYFCLICSCALLPFGKCSDPWKVHAIGKWSWEFLTSGRKFNTMHSMAKHSIENMVGVDKVLSFVEAQRPAKRDGEGGQPLFAWISMRTNPRATMGWRSRFTQAHLKHHPAERLAWPQSASSHLFYIQICRKLVNSFSLS